LETEKYQDKLSKKRQDLIDFEGNANGFSVLTASRPGIEGGLRISYATLGFYEISKESLPKNQLTTYQTKLRFLQTDKSFLKKQQRYGINPK
jgi:dGTPase